MGIYLSPSPSPSLERVTFLTSGVRGMGSSSVGFPVIGLRCILFLLVILPLPSILILYELLSVISMILPLLSHFPALGPVLDWISTSVPTSRGFRFLVCSAHLAPSLSSFSVYLASLSSAVIM